MFHPKLLPRRETGRKVAENHDFQALIRHPLMFRAREEQFRNDEKHSLPNKLYQQPEQKYTNCQVRLLLPIATIFFHHLDYLGQFSYIFCKQDKSVFSISTKSHYAITAIMQLALHYGKGLLQIKDIVEARNIPKNYLEQIFNRLNRHGIIRSVRGNRGGYALSIAPEQLSVLDVMESLEGPIRLCAIDVPEALHVVYRDVETAAKSSFSISFADLIANQNSSRKKVMYYI
ncbi:MAG: Rrf2 family transcriptional regulator [Chitinivibrionales bacterium]|nr:Rrf2 family transcriptional regulator [Chitinivibrionales bacterium]